MASNPKTRDGTDRCIGHFPRISSLDDGRLRMWPRREWETIVDRHNAECNAKSQEEYDQGQ